jgi:nucleotide sugar dehydrogenase
MQAKTVTVIGLGKIGLPLAVSFALKGFRVFGVDKNSRIIKDVNAALEPHPGEENLDTKLKQAIDCGNLIATINLEGSVSKSEVVVVVVPLYTDKDNHPDFGSIDEVTQGIGKSMKLGTLISFETTLPIGTTRNRIAPRLEHLSGLRVGKDFNLVFSPERVLTGRIFKDLREYPKLVGGVTPVCTEVGSKFYESVFDFNQRIDLLTPNGVWQMQNCEAAEFAKLAETTYRDVNIALANQFALFAQESNLNVFEIIEAANSQPFSHIHKPGIAVGGHCIPVYPKLYLSTDLRASIVQEARRVNEAMPENVISNLERIHGSCSGQRIAILGLSYRGGVKESAFSGAFSVSELLKSKGAKVLLHDPLYSDEEITEYGFVPYHIGEPVDVIVVQADHENYKKLLPKDFPRLKTVVDGRGILDANSWRGLNFISVNHKIMRSE